MGIATLARAALLLALLGWVQSVSAMVRPGGDRSRSDILDNVHANLSNFCESVKVPPCLGVAPRDVIFVIDRSASMNPDTVNGEMLTYVQQLYCSFDQAINSTVGLITFGFDVKVVLPMERRTTDSWANAVETLRGSLTVAGASTPLAEAMELAELELKERGEHPEKVVIIVTDGVPNPIATAVINGLPSDQPSPVGYPFAAKYYPSTVCLGTQMPANCVSTYNSYLGTIIPRAASSLKKIARVMMLAVPSATGEVPDARFFKGLPGMVSGPSCTADDTPLPVSDTCNPNSCTWCSKFASPISSNLAEVCRCTNLTSPVVTNINRDIFTATYWNATDMVALTQVSVCASNAPTVAPTTTAPSQAPTTTAPSTTPTTSSPSRSPSKAPINKPTSSPSKAPTAVCGQLPDAGICMEKRRLDVVYIAHVGADTAAYLSNLLDFISMHQCLYSSNTNRVGLITYGVDVQVVIPLAMRTFAQWQIAVDNAVIDGPRQALGSAPLAEALETAYRELMALPGGSDTPLVQILTAGLPDPVPYAINDPPSGQFLPSVWGGNFASKYYGSLLCYDSVGFTCVSPFSYEDYYARMQAAGRALRGLPLRATVSTLLLPDPETHKYPSDLPYTSQPGTPNAGAPHFCDYDATCLSNAPNECDWCDLFYDPRGDQKQAVCRCATSAPDQPLGNVRYTTTMNLTDMIGAVRTDACATLAPSKAPTTSQPSRSPSKAPTTSRPSASPSRRPTTSAPSRSPTTSAPSRNPTTSVPSRAPVTNGPSVSPTTSRPTRAPTTSVPSVAPTTSQPSSAPRTSSPTGAPTTSTPSAAPATTVPSRAPTTTVPSRAPSTSRPSAAPTSSRPTVAPTTSRPTRAPTTTVPSVAPVTSSPSTSPTMSPTTSVPSAAPTASPVTSSPTDAPLTSSPSRTPSRAPTTMQPSNAPTEPPVKLDLFFVMDRSGSMNYFDKNCRNVIRAGNVTENVDGQDCWDMWLFFAARMVQVLREQNPRLGFEGNGLRVAAYAFWCRNGQSTPQALNFMPLTSSEAVFTQSLANAHGLAPNGGTCPSEALERIVSLVAMTMPRNWPDAAVITMTDGVLYDMPRPGDASRALRNNLCVLTFAIGIAVGVQGPGDRPGSTGFTPQELQRQKTQLRVLAGADDRVYSFIGDDRVTGISKNPWQDLLNLAERMPVDIIRAVYDPSGRNCTNEVYCDYSNEDLCTGNNFNRRFCKWVKKGRAALTCRPVTNCGMWNGDVASCRQDPYCRVGELNQFGNYECVTNPNTVPSLTQAPTPWGYVATRSPSDELTGGDASCAFLEPGSECASGPNCITLAAPYNCQPYYYCNFVTKKDCEGINGKNCYWEPVIGSRVCRSFHFPWASGPIVEGTGSPVGKTKAPTPKKLKAEDVAQLETGLGSSGVGAVVGVMFGLAGVVALAAYLRRRSKQSEALHKAKGELQAALALAVPSGADAQLAVPSNPALDADEGDVGPTPHPMLATGV